jgi:hypothetical protein
MSAGRTGPRDGTRLEKWSQNSPNERPERSQVLGGKTLLMDAGERCSLPLGYRAAILPRSQVIVTSKSPPF